MKHKAPEAWSPLLSSLISTTPPLHFKTVSEALFLVPQLSGWAHRRRSQMLVHMMKQDFRALQHTLPTNGFPPNEGHGQIQTFQLCVTTRRINVKKQLTKEKKYGINKTIFLGKKKNGYLSV